MALKYFFFGSEEAPYYFLIIMTIAQGYNDHYPKV